MKRIYLDNAATTKPDHEVILAMAEVNNKFWGNPSSIYNEGQEAKQILEESRRSFASLIGADSEEIIFTSGGTEADNTAIKGIVDAFYGKYQDARNKIQTNFKSQITNSNLTIEQFNNSYPIPHIITSAFEHHAVLDTVKELEKSGLIEATYIKPNPKGLIEVEDVEAAIRPNTILVSIMYVNNEIGTVQPIRDIAEAITRINSKKQETIRQLADKQISKHKSEKENNLAIKQFNNRILFHTDAVQAVEYFELSPDYLGIDMMSFAAHKFHGPKGVGALYIRKGTPISHQMIGGGQERKKRAGTENVAGIKGMVAALQQVKSQSSTGSDCPEYQPNGQKSKVKSVEKLRDRLIDGILGNIPDTKLNGDREKRSPANVNISFMNAEGESIILMLDMVGISVSSGSACTSGSLDPSHVLLSMGIPHEEAHGSVRFSLGKDTTEEDIDKVLELLPPIIERLRSMSPIKS